MWKVLSALGAAALLGGCSAGTDIPQVEAGIAVFHKALNAQQYDAIYTSSSPEMKAATSQASLVQLLSAIHRKLGNFQSGSTVGWTDNVNTNGHFVSIRYSAKYDGGAAEESFIYQVDDRGVLLNTYRIDSTALIVN